MAKFCMCGRETCPICKAPSGPPLEGIPLKKKGKLMFGGVIPPVKPTPVTESNVPVTKGNAVVTVGNKVPCSCGCGKLVDARPVYFSKACKVRAWRKRGK